MPCIIIGQTRAIVGYVCVIAGRRETHREKFMRGRNEQPNRTKWTYLASPRINKQQQMTAYVRPFLRHRFHRSGSRSVKDPFLSLSLSSSSSRTRVLHGPPSISRHPHSCLFILPRSWTARGDPPEGSRVLRGSFARRSLPIPRHRAPRPSSEHFLNIPSQLDYHTPPRAFGISMSLAQARRIHQG